MNFTDYLFVPAFLLMALVYFLVPLAGRWIVLLAASLLFYAGWSKWGMVYLTGAVLAAWAAALILERLRGKGTPKEKLRPVLWAGAALLLAVLVLVKLRAVRPESLVVKFLPEGLYNSLMSRLVKWWLPADSAPQRFFARLWERFPSVPVGSMLAPLGISYFTLSLVGYLADVYWKKEEAEKNPFKLLLFAAYFPKIVEGPIARHRLCAAQLTEGHRFDYDSFCFGLQRMLWGYFKKLVIADRLGLFTGTVFGSYQDYHGGILLTAAVFAAFQLYCDFSGCMDMALGMSEALGITLEENFNRPFFSRSAAEFWRRWHITLGAWFRDYVYMPLAVSPAMIRLSGRVRDLIGGKKAGAKTGGEERSAPKDREKEKRAAKRSRRAGKAVLTIVPTGIVWLLTGIWHGTGPNYVLWGVYWGLIIICSAVFEPEIKKLAGLLRINGKSAGWQSFCRLRTFGLFVISRIISLPSTPGATLTILTRILRSFALWELFDGTLLNQGLDWPNFVLALVLLVFLMQTERLQEKGVEFRKEIAAFPIAARWTIYLGAIFFVLIFGVYGAQYDAAAFVYANF